MAFDEFGTHSKRCIVFDEALMRPFRMRERFQRLKIFSRGNCFSKFIPRNSNSNSHKPINAKTNFNEFSFILFLLGENCNLLFIQNFRCCISNDFHSFSILMEMHDTIETVTVFILSGQ